MGLGLGRWRAPDHKSTASAAAIFFGEKGDREAVGFTLVKVVRTGRRLVGRRVGALRCF